jgi:hypothetical protein
MYRGRRLANARRLRGGVSRKAKPQAEARVNAGRNSNGPMVPSLPPTWVTMWCAPSYMLETPSIQRYSQEPLSSGENQLPVSNNPTGADNQQERLIRLGWVVGFVDGEGCFSIGFIHQPRRKHRSGYKAGIQVFHEFAVTQGERSLEALRQLHQFFGVGQIVINRRQDNHREHLYRYVVRRRNELLEVIIPFFRTYPLQTAKREDFEKFAQCVEWMASGYHLTRDGLDAIAQLAATMNRRKDRTDRIRILRDHTLGTSKTR